MVTNAETNEAELENPYILIANKKLANIQELLPCLQSVTSTGASLLIIADEFQDDILSTLIVNKLRGFNCVAVKSPSYGDSRKLILEDIAILCGGRVVSDETGTRLENAAVNSGILGRAAKVVVNKENTVIIGGAGSKEAVEERAAGLRAQIESSDKEYEKSTLRERLAKLTSGIGIISVGATTEAERKEKRDRVDDAFSAAKAAVKGGIVAGGGIALMKAKEELNAWIKETDLPEDEAIGANILANSLEMPFRKIIENAGLNADVVKNNINSTLVKNNTGDENGNHGAIGFNAITKKYVDMVEDGIIDPTEVVISEVQNASSIGGLLLTTDCLVVEEEEPKANASASMGSMM